MNVTIELMNASSETILPSKRDFQRWADSALSALASADGKDIPDNAELSIRVVDEKESAALNENYRKKKGATNILSFPCEDIEGTGVHLLGDLAICAPLVKKEAAQQHKSEEAHWAHLTVHGVLHLSGYDHEIPEAADRMETLEISILESLGYPNPYNRESEGNE